MIRIFRSRRGARGAAMRAVRTVAAAEPAATVLAVAVLLFSAAAAAAAGQPARAVLVLAATTAVLAAQLRSAAAVRVLRGELTAVEGDADEWYARYLREGEYAAQGWERLKDCQEELSRLADAVADGAGTARDLDVDDEQGAVALHTLRALVREARARASAEGLDPSRADLLAVLLPTAGHDINDIDINDLSTPSPKGGNR